MLSLVVVAIAAIGLLDAHGTMAVMIHSPGCGKPMTQQVTPGHAEKLHMETSDGRRTYLLHLPSTYSNKTPTGLIFSFHGKGESLEHHQNVSMFSDPAVNPDMIAVYPEGRDHSWEREGMPSPDVDDVGFIHGLLNHLKGELCVDTTRIHAAGKSDGGGFAARLLACRVETATEFASFATVADYTGTNPDHCDPERCDIHCEAGRKNVALLEFHGDQDRTVPYEGGPRKHRCMPSIPHFTQTWARRDGFTGSNVTTSLFGGAVAKNEFGPPGPRQDIVTLYIIQGLGHAWPSTAGNMEGPATDIDASKLIMKFFNKHTLDDSIPNVSALADVAVLPLSVFTQLPGSATHKHP
nr:putative feruloyl esterase c [Quercus suber]